MHLYLCMFVYCNPITFVHPRHWWFPTFCACTCLHSLLYFASLGVHFACTFIRFCIFCALCTLYTLKLVQSKWVSEWRALQGSASCWLHTQKYLHPRLSQYLSELYFPCFCLCVFIHFVLDNLTDLKSKIEVVCTTSKLRNPQNVQRFKKTQSGKNSR